MDNQRAIELLKIERECINRNNQPFGQNCDRKCSKCDLVQDTEELIEMYDFVIEHIADVDKKKGAEGMRLIDADELLIAMDTWDKFGYDEQERLIPIDNDDERYVPYVHYADMVKAVNGMPTIDARAEEMMHIKEKLKREIGIESIEEHDAQVIDKFTEALKSRLGDAIYPQDFESMRNLIDDVARDVNAR